MKLGKIRLAVKFNRNALIFKASKADQTIAKVHRIAGIFGRIRIWNIYLLTVDRDGLLQIRVVRAIEI